MCTNNCNNYIFSSERGSAFNPQGKIPKKGGDKNFITILESNSFIYSMGWKLLQNGDVQLDKNAKVAAYEAYSCRSI